MNSCMGQNINCWKNIFWDALLYKFQTAGPASGKFELALHIGVLIS
jgi:hypothetical protein